MNNFGKLYIVATPIGNLEDISLRAIKTLCDVDVILVEDTRVTQKLLQRLGENGHRVNARLTSYHAHTNDDRKFDIMKLLLDGKNIALVTDAGTPGISDPGNELINFILEKEPDINVIPIPGASALAAALSISGINTNSFVFLGFLPKKGNTKLFDWLRLGKITFCFYDSPKRILKSLSILVNEFDDPKIVLARELTKMHETIYRGKTSEVLEKLPKSIKGEIVVIVEL